MERWQHRWFVLSLATLVACSEQVTAWRIAANCPVHPAADRHLEFGRTYTLRIDTPLFGDAPKRADLIEGGQVTGQIPLDCVTTRVALDEPRWIGPGGTTLFERPSTDAASLGRLERDTPVHSVAADGEWRVVAVGGIPAGFVAAVTLASRPADLTSLPEFLVAAYASGGATRIVEVLPDLKQKERKDVGVATALAKIVDGAMDRGDRTTAGRILEALDQDELTSEPFRDVACRLAVSGFASPWDIGADLGTACPGAPALPEEDHDVAVEGERECPRDTELLGVTASGAATAWACATPDAVLLNRPRGEDVDLSYESRLDHVFVRDRHGRIADLIDDSGYAQARGEGRWTFRTIHVVGLGACLEWQDQRSAKSMTYLSCFPPPPTSPKNSRELIKVGATRRDGSTWHKSWTVVRDQKGHLLCLSSDSKGAEAYRFLPGRIKNTKQWPTACEVKDSVAPRTDD